jgi:glutamyl-tRNA synthetase
MAARSPHIPTDRPVRTRIAPSPTGDPHVGTAYMGLVNMTLARQHGGQFLLRIDDTDRTRYREGSEQAIFTALRWLGLDWDEGPDKGGPCGPYRQSERTAIYREHCDRLIASGHAYRCFCSKERLDEVRKAQQARKEQARYDRLCMSLAPDVSQARAAKGEKHVVRLKFPTEGDTVVADLLRGEVKTPNATGQDQVLLKEDGFPTYHLASCVDDALMKITHIIRAEEWLASAPIHKVLFDALGYPMPVLCHMPLLRNNDKDKTKISKRKNPTSLLYYRDAGFLPEALLNFLGLMGWGGPKGQDGQCKEHFSLAEMREAFRLEDIRLGSPVFDIEKLKHVNAVHQRALPADEFVRRAKAYLFDDERFARIAGLVQHRTETLGEFMWMADFVFQDVKQEPSLALPKRVKTDEDRAVWMKEAWFCLDEAMKALDNIPWTKEALEPALAGLKNLRPQGAAEPSERLELKEFLMLVRVAMCGKTATPPLYESMEVLGKSRSLGRLGDALRSLPSPSKKEIDKRGKGEGDAPTA